MGKKEKKEKVKYYDDGRTVADMSGVHSGPRLSKNHNPYRPRPKAKDVWTTYWNAVKMLFRPMMVVLVGLAVLYMILYFIFSLL